jgi:hypothetical protein
MSVLSFPRIYFSGFMEWDPCTFNNNDWEKFPTYDPTNAALNWSFLRKVEPPITKENFTTTFRPWARTLQADFEDDPCGPRVPGEWNMFGSHAVSFVQYEQYTTTITGGALGYGEPVTSDPLIGGPVQISGDKGSGPGRLVDTNPASPWSSQIYFGQLAFGSGATAITGQRIVRMHSRWLNPNRIYSTAQELTQPAASIGVCFQTGIPFELVSWPAGGSSALAAALQAAAGAPGALGIMVRFTAYVNVYFVNGILNATAAQPRDYDSLAQCLATAWAAWDADGDTSQFFSNPCYSHVVGTLGVWNEGELASMPGGRILNAGTAVAPQGTDAEGAEGGGGAPEAPFVPPTSIRGHQLRANAVVAANAPVPLGPAAVEVDYAGSLLSVDLSSTVPELGTPGQWPSDLTKADFGPLTVGVTADGAFTPIAQVQYEGYQQSAYQASAGIVDIPFPDPGTGALLQSGTLAIQAQGQAALVEQVLTAETDRRGIYLNQNEQARFDVQVCQSGTPAAGVNLLVARYDSSLSLVQTDGAQLVDFMNGEQQTITVPNGSGPAITTGVTVLTTDSNGIATVGIAAQSPSFPVLGFFPYTGDTLPEPPPGFNFTDDAFYTTVRVLPFDNDVPSQFVDLWNTTHDPAQAWSFVYNEILYVYDMLFSVMLEYVDLGNQQAVESSVAAIGRVTSPTLVPESTSAMPITRDMSAGKRNALQLWLFLVAHGYQVEELTLGSAAGGAGLTGGAA